MDLLFCQVIKTWLSGWWAGAGVGVSHTNNFSAIRVNEQVQSLTFMII
ncbi:hypothetical protein [Mycobacterium leprae]|nr:hypothetical protein [Mycobacterium leprae]